MSSAFVKRLTSPAFLACFFVSFLLVVAYEFGERAKSATSDLFFVTSNEPWTSSQRSSASNAQNDSSLVSVELNAWALPLRREVKETKESVQKILQTMRDVNSLLQTVLHSPPALQSNISQDQLDGVISQVVRQVSTALEDSRQTTVKSVREKIERVEMLVSDDLAARSGGGGNPVLSSVSEKNAGKPQALEDCPVNDSSPKTLTWSPRPEKFLLTTCLYQQMSNRLGCIRSTMIYAAVLNRTLIFPHADASDRNYNFSLVLDVEHARKCLKGTDVGTGPQPIITLDEYLAAHGGHLEIKTIRCWRSHCQMRDTRTFDMKQYPTVVFPKRDYYWPLSGASNESAMPTQDFLKFYNVDDDVLVMGDVFNTRLSDSPHFDTASPFLQHCNTFFQPHPAIMAAATGFVRTFLGPRFMAAHWRRGDFFSYCKGCFHSVQETADCLREHAVQLDAQIIYLATNAEENEVGLLRELLSTPSHSLSVVRLPPGDLSQSGPWAESLHQLNLKEDSELIRLTLDRTICALARVFLSTRGSTFSSEIRAFRNDIGKRSCHDKYLCAKDAQEIWKR